MKVVCTSCYILVFVLYTFISLFLWVHNTILTKLPFIGWLNDWLVLNANIGISLAISWREQIWLLT
jgi:hypothetical protein